MVKNRLHLFRQSHQRRLISQTQQKIHRMWCWYKHNFWPATQTASSFCHSCDHGLHLHQATAAKFRLNIYIHATNGGGGWQIWRVDQSPGNDTFQTGPDHQHLLGTLRGSPGLVIIWVPNAPTTHRVYWLNFKGARQNFQFERT